MGHDLLGLCSGVSGIWGTPKDEKKDSNSHFPECAMASFPIWWFLVLELTLHKPDKKKVICWFLINWLINHPFTKYFWVPSTYKFSAECSGYNGSKNQPQFLPISAWCLILGKRKRHSPSIYMMLGGSQVERFLGSAQLRAGLSLS